MNPSTASIAGGNGGRVCWAVIGALCEGKKQGTFHIKREPCVKCDFFKIARCQDSAIYRPTKLIKFLTDTSDASFLSELATNGLRPVSGTRFRKSLGIPPILSRKGPA